MNYVTTNIRLPEEDYLRLKEEAVGKRKSLAAVIREKVGSKTKQVRSVEQLMAETRRLAKKNSQKLKEVDIVKVLREMRYEGKW